MGTFKPNQENYKKRKIIEFWSNLMQNSNEACNDRSMFEDQSKFILPVRVIELVKNFYTDAELKTFSKRLFSDYNGDNIIDSDDISLLLMKMWNTSGNRTKCKRVLKAIANEILDNLPMDNERSNFSLRLKEFQNALKLNKLELEIVTFAFLWSDKYGRFARSESSDCPMLFAKALNRSYGEIINAIKPTGRLRKYNVLNEDLDFNKEDFYGFLSGTVKEPLTNRFYAKYDVSDALPWNYYGESVKKDGEIIKELLNAIRPLAAHGKGRLNILLYGETGTGKTSFAKTLVRELKLDAFEIKQNEYDGKRVYSLSRFTGINVCNDCESGENSLMIVDEADELLRFNLGSFFDINRNTTEKGMVNEVLDKMKMPAIWISNSPIHAMD